MGNAPKRVRSTMSRVATGERPSGEGGDAGLVAQGREVIHAGQARHLPPGLLTLLALPFVGTSLGLFDSVFKEPAREPPEGRPWRRWRGWRAGRHHDHRPA